MPGLLRTMLFWVVAVVSFLILAPFVLAVAGDERKVHKIQMLWARFLLRVGGIRVSVKGVEHIKPYGSYVIMANHQSYIDILILLTLPVFIHWMAKRELFNIPLFGWMLKRMDGISIDRESPAKSYSSIKQAARKIEQGATVLIFPEGTRSATGELLPFNGGGFFLAILSRAVVLPVTIQGSRAIMPKQSFRVSPGLVSVTVAEPIATEGLSLKHRNHLREMIRKILARNLESQE